MTASPQASVAPPRPGALEGLLRLFTDVRPGEGAKALLLMVNVFMLLTCYYLLKPVREGGLAKLGIKTACIHRGLPLGLFNEENCHPGDVEKAAKDHPDINYVIYHSGWNPGAKRKEGAANDPPTSPPRLTGIGAVRTSRAAPILHPRSRRQAWGSARRSRRRAT